MSFLDQPCSILFGHVRLALITIRDGLSGRAEAIEYSHPTAFPPFQHDFW
jgi:hypothetical protein